MTYDIFTADIAAPQRGGSPPPEFIGFMLVGVLLGLGSFLFFQLNRDAALKRRIWPVLIVAVGLIFVGFIYCTTARQQPQVLYLMIPAVILISFLNIRMTRFCDSCGRTLHRQPLFSRTQFCPSCGAKLM